jgi:hypothetical protein
MKQAPTQVLNTADLDKRITKLEWRMKKEALVGTQACRARGAPRRRLVCKSPVDSLYYQARRLFRASESLFFRRRFA